MLVKTVLCAQKSVHANIKFVELWERAMQFLNERNILYQKQFGFQKRISTANVIIKH